MGFTESTALRPTLPPTIGAENYAPDRWGNIVQGSSIYMPGSSILPATIANRVLSDVHIAITQDAVNKAREEQLSTYESPPTVPTRRVDLDLGVISGRPEEPKKAFGIIAGLLVIGGILFFFFRR